MLEAVRGAPRRWATLHGYLVAWLPVKTTRALRRLYTPASPGHANNKHGAQFALTSTLRFNCLANSLGESTAGVAGSGVAGAGPFRALVRAMADVVCDNMGSRRR